MLREIQIKYRASEVPIKKGQLVGSSQDVYLWFKDIYDNPCEIFRVVFLNTKHRIITFQDLFRGTVDSCGVHPKEVVRTSLLVNASAVITIHNHPSGDPTPSREDERLTHDLKEACKTMDIVLLDHLIVGDHEYFSFAEKGIL